MPFSPYFSCYTLLLVMPHNLLLLYMSLLSLSFLAWLAVTVEGGDGCRGLRYSCFPCHACICVHLFVLVNVFVLSALFVSLLAHMYIWLISFIIDSYTTVPIQMCLIIIPNFSPFSFQQSSGQQIPLVVESCIRFINLHGKTFNYKTVLYYSYTLVMFPH